MKTVTRELALANAVQEMLANLSDDWQTSCTPEEMEAVALVFARLAVCRMGHVIAARHVYRMLAAAGGPGTPEAAIAALKAADETIKSDEDATLDTRH